MFIVRTILFTFGLHIVCNIWKNLEVNEKALTSGTVLRPLKFVFSVFSILESLFDFNVSAFVILPCSLAIGQR